MEPFDLKNVWNKEQLDATPEISLEKQKQIHLPLELIRKNMRFEFWSTTVTILGLLIFFLFKDMQEPKLKIYVIALLGSAMLVTAFYFTKFFSLYSNLTNLNFNTRDNLRDLQFQFKLNEQYYLSYYIAFVPFLICEMLLIFIYTPSLAAISGRHFLLIFMGTCVLALFILFVVGKWWYGHYYGKHISRINTLLTDLE